MQALVNGESLCKELAEAREEEQAAKTALEKVRSISRPPVLRPERRNNEWADLNRRTFCGQGFDVSPNLRDISLGLFSFFPALCGALLRKRRFFRLSA